jgi:hypothetical protein
MDRLDYQGKAPFKKHGVPGTLRSRADMRQD